MAFIYFFNDLYILLAMFFVTFFLTVLGKVWKQVYRVVMISCLPFFVFFVPAIGFSPGFESNKTALFSFVFLNYNLTLYFEGAFYVTIWTLRIATAIGGTLLFIFTTHPSHVTAILMSLHMPYKYVYAFISAFQLIPILSREARVVHEAQISRGLNLDVGLTERIKSIVYFIVPLTLGALDRAQARSIALESRGFSAPGRKTLLYPPHLKVLDYAVLVVIAIMTFVLLYVIVTKGTSPLWGHGCVETACA